MSGKPRRRGYLWLFIVFALVFVPWGATPWIVNAVVGVTATPSDLGQFGDQFGATNALFAGLAFAGVIVALRWQSQELRLQREELRLTREELERHRYEAGEYRKTAQRDLAEALFYRMLSLLAQRREDLEIEPLKPNSVNGKPVWQSTAPKRRGDLAFVHLRKSLTDARKHGDGVVIQLLLDAFGRNVFLNHLDGYASLLTSCVAHVRENLSDEARGSDPYFLILASQISRAEAAVWLHAIVCSDGLLPAEVIEALRIGKLCRGATEADIATSSARLEKEQYHVTVST
ncbi:MAG: hypothetical protein AAGI53_08250 [Planctomycetota bacterium]